VLKRVDPQRLTGWLDEYRLRGLAGLAPTRGARRQPRRQPPDLRRAARPLSLDPHRQGSGMPDLRDVRPDGGRSPVDPNFPAFNRKYPRKSRLVCCRDKNLPKYQIVGLRDHAKTILGNRVFSKPITGKDCDIRDLSGKTPIAGNRSWDLDQRLIAIQNNGANMRREAAGIINHPVRVFSETQREMTGRRARWSPAYGNFASSMDGNGHRASTAPR